MGFLGSLFIPSGMGYNDKKDPKNEVDPTAVCGCCFAIFFLSNHGCVNTIVPY